ITVEAINTVGEYKATVKLHREVKGEITLSVVAEE
ncbi:MAG: 50S ribosomal protein L9, partial [Alistipes sp.]|nr:50S ribosomal protein L9 [Alistipes sp.]MBQ5836526.1 50S ribosomal protein L9 [Alistipes sp.]